MPLLRAAVPLRASCGTIGNPRSRSARTDGPAAVGGVGRIECFPAVVLEFNEARVLDTVDCASVIGKITRSLMSSSGVKIISTCHRWALTSGS